MTKTEAKQSFSMYLEEHNIESYPTINDGIISTVIVLYHHEHCPDRTLEACVTFNNNFLEERVYYDSNAAGWYRQASSNRTALMKLINYININVWPLSADGAGGQFYQPQHLYVPRICLNEETGDIFAMSVIPFIFYELTQLQTNDYLTAFVPELMDRIAPAVFEAMGGQTGFEGAVHLLQLYLLE